MSVPMPPRSKNRKKVNRRWNDEEVRAYLAHAPEGVKLGLALGLFAGMREGDVVAAAWSGAVGGRLKWKSKKNGEDNDVPITGVLKVLLDAAPQTHARICLNSDGNPWASEDSFRSAFFKTVRKLQKLGLIGPGATFHGLRHTVGASGRDDGASDFHVAAALGDRSIAMAALYGAEADRRRGQDKVLGSLQNRFADATLETSLETAPQKRGGSRRKPLKKLEAWPRIELGYTDLQSDKSDDNSDA
jgi:integrase